MIDEEKSKKMFKEIDNFKTINHTSNSFYT
jgi:hypothetical protein